ncbi:MULTISPECIES: iron-siderophore ABC transporter substrate-binding protein [unclassified Mesorhizobium]|uniref:iron-siderophore ABC transporter substrate-binding protein n=1 Tax=unclassified Mesorhizobium TaxID=325217 RepID=UPI000FCBDA11|nr:MULTISPECIES: iron-siderophore ABC transporter substrate-binding protein [unclassified Mesorhizobium]RUU66608.1 iron-siderophore ABC transporter substrate-binding protein [Mesorhizobium sp. M7A.T.Ca.TU.009.01.1.1]RUU73650.1 iron-siderophore ABC transporter substrate-binding protein [Mesorhizobium sp. M7A.T.Ca.TU.009.01.1.2]RUT87894.1 iron-siderophore ABC transporter substrate-binding protein [Mesorhizobium sp. M7A.T.Ca.US.000.02.1.1]RUT92574.1 iron-siderophore ABC transporter substrate-bindi
MIHLPNRRQVLALAAAALLPPVAARAAAMRVAAIDWGMLETLLALGIEPVAATELIQFRKIAVEPRVPQSVTDLGLRGAPNYELLRIVAPDVIVISNFYEYQRPMLERIAPVFAQTVYEAGVPPYVLAEAATLALGEKLGRQAEAERYTDETADEIARLRGTLPRASGRPVFVISLGDSRHFRAFGRDSMFGDVLTLLGLVNAWTDETSYSAAAPVGLEALARVPEASILIVSPLPADVGRSLPTNALWNALPAVRQNRVAVLEPVNHFGCLPSARRFARLATAAIAGQSHG